MTTLQNNLLKELGEHKPMIMDLGDDVLLHIKWNEEKEIYEDEMGMTDMKLLVEIVKGEVKIEDKLVRLRLDEGENNG